MSNPRVFLDVSHDGMFMGRTIIEMEMQRVHKSANNFRALCTGERAVRGAQPPHYKSTVFYEVNADVLIGGDIQHNTGAGGESIYGPTYTDDSASIGFDQPGTVAMVPVGKALDSRFLITLKSGPPQKHPTALPVGRVIHGLDLLQGLGAAGGKIKIVNSGQMPQR